MKRREELQVEQKVSLYLAEGSKEHENYETLRTTMNYEKTMDTV